MKRLRIFEDEETREDIQKVRTIIYPDIGIFGRPRLAEYH